MLPKDPTKETFRAPKLTEDSNSKCYKGKVGKDLRAIGLTKDTWSPATRIPQFNLKELPPGAGLPHYAAARTGSENAKFMHSNPTMDRSPEGCKKHHLCKQCEHSQTTTSNTSDWAAQVSGC